MKKTILILALIGINFGVKAQNSFPSSGNVGIGITNPSEKLTVIGKIKANNSIISTANYGFLLNPSTGDAIIKRGTPGDLMISSNGTTSKIRFNYNYGGGNGGISIYDGGTTNYGTLKVNSNGDLNLFSKSRNIGIGTETPSNDQGWNGALDVHGSRHSKILTTTNTAGVKTGIFSHSTWQGVAVGRLGTESNHDLHLMAGYGKDQLIIKTNGDVGIGTTNPDSKLTVKGKIHAEEVKIDLSVPAPDYVFTKEYDLLTIEEVQDHIKEKGHLPNIPSATEMEKNGVELGIMNMKLLEKIEELTLYTIAQENKLNEQETRLKTLENKLALLIKK